MASFKNHLDLVNENYKRFHNITKIKKIYDISKFFFEALIL